MNRTTRIIVATIGFMLGISGIDHGFFETLQGNTPTNGLFIQAIGDANQMWLYGTEDALTIIPNFLLTGILAIIFSIALIIWSVGFVHKKHGPSVFFLLFLFLFLTGGGIAQIVFFIPTWLASTRINSLLAWWRKALTEKVQQYLAKLWPFSLSVVLICFLIGLEIAIFGKQHLRTSGAAAVRRCWAAYTRFTRPRFLQGGASHRSRRVWFGQITRVPSEPSYVL